MYRKSGPTPTDAPTDAPTDDSHPLPYTAPAMVVVSLDFA